MKMICCVVIFGRLNLVKQDIHQECPNLEHLSVSSNRQVVECSAGGNCAGCYPNGDPNGYGGSTYGTNGTIKLKVFGKYPYQSLYSVAR